MIINLKKCATQGVVESLPLRIDTRLPAQLVHGCDVTCAYKVTAFPDYYQLTLETQGLLDLECQNCMQPFQYAYQHQTKLAVCQNEVKATEYMSQWDCVVAEQGEIDLLDIITDDLHLFLPEKHPEGCAP